MARKAEMDKNLKQTWVEALRSGEFEQTDDSLQDRDGFCCLGVLCEIHPAIVQSKRSDLEEGIYYKMYGGNNESDTQLPTIKVLTQNTQFKLMQLNDAGESFSKIADYIEKNIKAV